MKVKNIILPRGISKAIIESQVLSKFKGDEYILYSLDRDANYNGLRVNLDFKNIAKGSWVYTRSVTDFIYIFIYSALFNRKYHICFDFRGIISEESFLKHKSYGRFYLLRALEYFAYKLSNEVWTVSESLKSVLTNKFGKRNIGVQPCKIDESLLTSRTFENKGVYTFLYLGSLAPWQGFDKACMYYKTIESNDTRFLVITRDISNAKEIIKHYQIQNYSVLSCERDEVFKHIDTADFGFLIRENNIINNTASPIKFIEYIARGVIPIMTDSIGDYSNIMHDIGYIVKDTDKTLDFNRLKEKLSQDNFNKLYDVARIYTWS